MRRFSVWALLAIVSPVAFGQISFGVATAQSVDTDLESRQAIDDLLTRFRRAAAQADADRYFDCLDGDGIFFGTDGQERFTVEQLKDALQPSFSQGTGWQHKIRQRHIFVGPDSKIGWFDEQSERANFGEMRTTGVVKKTAEGWKIVQYHVALVVPNEAVDEVVAVIRKSTVPVAPPQPASADDAPLTAEQRQQMDKAFEYVWQKIRDSYWDPELGGVDWQAARNELQPKLEAARTRTEALQVLDTLVSRMQVSHFSIIRKSAYQELANADETGSRGGESGLDVRIIDDQVIVVSVTPGSPAADQGVHAGWVVETIDELAVAERLAEVRQELADNPHQRLILASAANSRVRGRVGDEITVTFRDGNDRQVTKTLELVPPRGEPTRFGHLPEFRVWYEIDSLDDGIGYFRFNAFMNPVQLMAAFNKFMTDHRDARGIIIDVRGNGGGSGEIAMGMVGWLMPGEKASAGKVILRDNELDMIVHPRPRPYSGPVVVLIDEMSVSAAEFFASAIRDLTHARLIGTRTAGAVLGSQIERLPTGDGFQYAAANFISIRTGKTLEGTGVSPHQVVKPDRRQLLAGKDSAIESAIQWIQSHPR